MLVIIKQTTLSTDVLNITTLLIKKNFLTFDTNVEMVFSKNFLDYTSSVPKKVDLNIIYKIPYTL